MANNTSVQIFSCEILKLEHFKKIFNVKLSSTEFPAHYTSLQEIYVSWSANEFFIYLFSLFVYMWSQRIVQVTSLLKSMFPERTG